jgi:phosphoribosylpyrophosphate synthetase
MLTYVRGHASSKHQSAHTVRAYKQQPRSEKASRDMSLMVVAATVIHGECMGAAAGGAWNAVTFVPSARGNGPTHPVAELARQVRPDHPEHRFLLSVGPGFGVPGRSVRPDRFAVPPEFTSRVAGRRVLLVDDTWTTGSKAQSAAVSLHAAGALSVTVLCVARWLRDDWPEHRALLDSAKAPYDASICPVIGEVCDRGAQDPARGIEPG